MIYRPQSRVTSVRPYGLDAIHVLSRQHELSNVDIVTFIVLGIRLMHRDERERIIHMGAKIDGLLKLGGTFQENGIIVWDDTPTQLTLPSDLIDIVQETE